MSNNAAAPRRSVSVLGLGPMGAPIARNLLKSYGPILVWNRTYAKAAALEEFGGWAASTPAEAACEVTLTVLPDLSQVRGVVEGPDGLLVGWKRENIQTPVLVVHGTVSSVGISQYAQNMWENHQVRVMDAPLSGGTVGAENATLSIMVGGDELTAQSLTPVFEHIGRTIRYLGPSGSGQLAKACNQIVVATTIAALSEAMILARLAGLNVEVLQELIQGGLARTELMEQKGQNWVDEHFEHGGSARNQLKDLHFAQEAARIRHANLPTTQLVTELFEQMVGQGRGDLDHTGLYLTIRESAVNHDVS